jgi:hypothetical protein
VLNGFLFLFLFVTADIHAHTHWRVCLLRTYGRACQQYTPVRNMYDGYSLSHTHTHTHKHTHTHTEQSAVKNIVLERNVLNSVSPTFSLMKNAPKDISIFSPQWAYHNESWRKTCWFIVLLVIPADQCKTLGSMSCVESGATDYLGSPKREVSVTVKTNSSGDILNVHLRQTSIGSGTGILKSQIILNSSYAPNLTRARRRVLKAPVKCVKNSTQA